MLTPEKAAGIRRAGIFGVYPAHAECSSSFGIAADKRKVTRAKNPLYISGYASRASGTHAPLRVFCGVIKKRRRTDLQTRSTGASEGSDYIDFKSS